MTSFTLVFSKSSEKQHKGYKQSKIISGKTSYCLSLSYRELSRVRRSCQPTNIPLCSKSGNTYTGIQQFYYPGSYISQTFCLVDSLEILMALVLGQIFPYVRLCSWAVFHLRPLEMMATTHA